MNRITSLRFLFTPSSAFHGSHRRAYSTKPAQKIGIIGLGNVGSTVAKNLLNSGFTVSALLDTNVKAGQELPGDIPRPGNPKELAAMCDVVITALPAPPHVRKVLKGEDGVLAGLRSGGVWIDHSTTDYQQTLELAKEAGMTGFRLACAVQIAKNETKRKLDARDLRTVGRASSRITFTARRHTIILDPVPGFQIVERGCCHYLNAWDG